MTGDDLKIAIEIQKEIKELENFIFSAERVWTGKIVKRTSNFIFKSGGYGFLREEEYNMNTEMAPITECMVNRGKYLLNN